MKIKSAKSFRYWYKTKVKEIERNDPYYNENFLGTYHKVKGRKTVKGFFEMYHGDKPDIASYLPSILKIAEDGQAIYEFLQNAVDCRSTHFYIFYNENYFLAINNGRPFDIEGLQSILNIAQTTKTDPDSIGRFGIGFKLAHRLVGKNEGTDELVQQYKGPILFSWSRLEDLESLLNNEPIEPLVPNKKNYQDFIKSPYLLKLLLTNFPSDPNETIKDIEFRDKILFPQEELNELILFLNANFNLHSDSLKKNVLNQGSLFFIKLGEDKKKLLDKDYSELVNGIQYSMNTLKSLQKVYINNDDIGKIPLQLEEGIIAKGSDVFERISPEYKEFDIKFAIGFNQIKFGYEKSYEKIKLLKEKPNFYKYFPMGDEINGFGFIIHCDSFSNEANRRKLHEDDINGNLFPELAKFITLKLNEYKKTDPNKFLNLYASLLLSDIPERQNNKWLKSIFYDELLNSLKNNIPTKTGFSDNAQNVKVNKLKIQLNLSDFGLSHIQWFEWNNDADNLLIEEAEKEEKLGLEDWGIRDIIENANLESINNWIEYCDKDKDKYEEFLKGLEESYLRKETKEKICQIKLFKFSDNKFYSFNEVIKKDQYGKPIFGYSNCFYCSKKTKVVNNELVKLGLVVSDLLIEDYPNIFSSIILPDEKKHYDLIAKWCVENGNKLLAEEKKNLFLNFINETTKFDNVAEGTFKDLHLFCDSNSVIKPLNRLIDCKLNTARWLNTYKIKSEEFFTELIPYLVSEQEAIFKEIYLPEKDIILSELTEANEIKSLIKLYQENKRQFFKEFIIKKTDLSFSIAKKINNTFQVQSSDQEAIKFLDAYCTHNLFVLPQEFSSYKDEDGIVKADDLHSLILNFVNANEHKEILVDIVKYKAKYQFLQKLTEFKFNPNQTYSTEDYEFKILDLICSEFFVSNNSNQQTNFKNFRNKLVIETAERNFKHSEIPPVSNKISIASKEFSLSNILPLTHQNSNLISDLITQFSQQGISSERLNALFGVNEEINFPEIFKKFSEQTQTLQNAEQLFFLVHYNKHIAKVDLSKLGFDITCAVFPSDFALKKEELPEYLQEWIKNNEIKLSEIEKIGVWTEDTVIVELRKFLKGEVQEFQNTRIAQETRFNNNETSLFNTLEWLKEREIKLSAEEQFSTLKKIVEVINDNRTRGDLEIKEIYDFEFLNENSKEWKTTENNTISLYNGEMPKIVELDEIKGYAFYRYNNGDYTVNENSIYINENSDKKKTLQKVASDENNNFSFEELWALFGESSSREQELEKEIALLKQQVAKADSATLGTEFSNDISQNDQKEANREAKEIVKEKLEAEGFVFTEGIGEYSTINGVTKEGLEYPLVIKSYKSQDEPLKIGANEWMQLMNPNSMFWVHFGNRKLGCLKINELLRSQDKISISFDTSNLEREDKIEKFSKVLRYFKNIHFDFNSLKPSNVADNLNNYRFDERKEEEDLSGDDETIL